MAQTPLANPEPKLETVTTSEENAYPMHRQDDIYKFRSAAEYGKRPASLLPETKHLVLDRKDMTYLDIFGLGVLVGVYLSTRRQDCQLRLINVSQQAKDVLRITNLTYLV